MIKFIRTNYNRARWLTYVALFISVTFSSIFTIEDMLTYISMANGIAIPHNILVFLLVGAVSALIEGVFISLGVRLIVNFSRIVVLPLNEITIFATMFAVVRNLILGALNLLYLYSPVFVVWGSIVFNLVATLIAAILFYNFVKKTYLNANTSIQVFKVFAVVFFVYFAIILVGGII